MLIPALVTAAGICLLLAGAWLTSSTVGLIATGVVVAAVGLVLPEETDR